MSKLPAWAESEEARRAAADAAVALQGQGQTMRDIALSMDLPPATLEQWVGEYFKRERIRGEYIAPEHDTVEGHEKRLDMAAAEAEEVHGLGWFKTELRASLNDSDRAFMEKMDHGGAATHADRARLEGIQKAMLVSHEFVIRLFEFVTHGFQVTKYRERHVRVKRLEGYTMESGLIASVLPSGATTEAKRLRKNRMVVVRDPRGRVCRVFLRATYIIEDDARWRVEYEEPFIALDKQLVGDRFMHLYHLAKIDRESTLTQAQLGKLAGKTKAASSAMERGMDKEIRERSQSRTGFLVKPPKKKKAV